MEKRSSLLIAVLMPHPKHIMRFTKASGVHDYRQITQALNMSISTVAHLLKRAGLNRLSQLQPPL